MKKAIIFLSLVSVIAYTNAQDAKAQHPVFKVTSFSSSIGFSGAMTSNTNADYYTLQGVAEDPGLFEDITEFSNNSNSWNQPQSGMYYRGNGGMGMGFYGGGSGNGSAVFNLGLTPYSKKLAKYRDNRELRISAGCNFGTRNSFSYSDNNSFVIDTFQSVSGNGRVFADSSITKYLNYSLEFTDINFGLSYLFKTDVNRRVHFYAGAGINYGIAIRSAVRVVEDTYRSVYYYNEFNKPSEGETYYSGNINNSGYTYSSSITNLKSPMQFVRAYIPIGLSLKLSKKPASFFNQVNLYTELNPGVELQIINDGKTYANPYIGVAFIGINYHW
jgi:hypothetical protein